jgi:hypothetical protein
MAQGCRTGPSGYLGWRAGTTTLCHSRLYSPVSDYEFGYRKPSNKTVAVTNLYHNHLNIPSANASVLSR